MINFRNITVDRIEDNMFDNFCSKCERSGRYIEQCPVTCLVKAAINGARRRKQALIDMDGVFGEEDARHALTGE